MRLTEDEESMVEIGFDDVQSRKQVRLVKEFLAKNPTHVALSRKGRFAALMNVPDINCITILNIATSHKWVISADLAKQFDLRCCEFSPDGRMLATMTKDQEIRIMEVTSGLVRFSRSSQANVEVEALMFSPDRRYFAWCTSSGVIQIRDLWSGTETPVIRASQEPIYALAYSCDGKRLATSGRDTTALLWDVPELLKQMPPPKMRLDKPAAMELEQLWQNLDNGPAENVVQAMDTFAQFPEETLALFPDKLKQIKGPDIARIKRSISELGDGKYAVREKASHALTESGEAARESLKEALKQELTAEARRRVEVLLSNLDKGHPPTQLQAFRAIEVLERIGGNKARQVLADYLKQTSDADVKREIEETMARMGK
jgi:hypothetical protein